DGLDIRHMLTLKRLSARSASHRQCNQTQTRHSTDPLRGFVLASVIYRAPVPTIIPPMLPHTSVREFESVVVGAVLGMALARPKSKALTLPSVVCARTSRYTRK